MNYIYSVFKRSNTNGTGNRFSIFYLKFVMLSVFSYVFFTFLILNLIEKQLFENGSTAFQIFIGVSMAFVMIYPLIYAVVPGYKYLEHVQKYSWTKAIIISGLIAITPLLIVLLILNHL